ncbi:1-phosphofructokinase [Virgibacillus xinjiangensis]|uniref:Tagatose-6-phosphate kinase n=1 Tax=Virgibacillus xinjiangensis TaxID=393090 RepID=A0ABV7CZ00_9BACI
MIYTCTFTPSIDYTTYLKDFEAGQLNRAETVYYYPGGKGINVSRVLTRLETGSIALGFAGGFTGEYLNHFLQGEGIRTDFIDTGEITRINVKIKAKNESELNGPGPHLDERHLKELLQKVDMMKENDWFVLAGSLPASIPAEFYEKLTEAIRKKGVHFVLDTSGTTLRSLLSKKPFLIKPNIEELGELFHTKISNKEEAIHYAKKLVEDGTTYVMVSMGGEGAILVDRETTWTAASPEGTAVNTVGAGDSMVAGFLSSYQKNMDAEEAFRFAIACGSATAFQTDLCRKEDAEELLDRVSVKIL